MQHLVYCTVIPAVFLFNFFILPLPANAKPVIDIQPLDADTLFFYNEIEFHDFLEYYGLKYYTVLPPVAEFDCTESGTVPLYDGPKYAYDYLHEDIFFDFPFTILVDHYGTRKIVETLMPSLGDPDANLCNVNLYVTNPETGQVAVFYDEYNWIDENGRNIFNANKKMYWLWGFDAGTITFPIEAIQEGTDYDFTFPDIIPSPTMKLNFDTITIYTQVLYYQDADGDGFGNPLSATYAYPWAPPADYVADNTDCDDTDFNTHPGAFETCNGKDDNCDGAIDEGFALASYYLDADGDTYGNNAIDSVHCAIPVGYVSDNSDCNDNDNTIYPGAPELPDGLDNNCNDEIDEGVVSVSAIDNGFTFLVYPNPASNVLYLQWNIPLSEHTDFAIHIVNTLGIAVYTDIITTHTTVQDYQIALELPAGYYLLHIQNQDHQYVYSLIIN